MLADSYLRKHNYLRISITDKCNLRCRYCMPSEGLELLSHDEVLRNEEFIRLIGVFVEMGINKVRFTGGEPFIRKGFIDIISGVRKYYPDIDLCITTNGILLGEYLDDLVKLNVKSLNISLDTLNRDRYTKITGRDHFEGVLRNIEKAEATGFFNIKVNCVLFRETLKEIESFLDYFKDKNIFLRFIERMPFTEEDNLQSFLPASSLIDELKKKGNLKRNCDRDTQVALMYDLTYKEKYSLGIGVIPPVTHKFCSSCNRLRITSDGLLKTCLHSSDEYNLKSIVREGPGNDELKKKIANAVSTKNKEHNLECDSEDGGCSSVVNVRNMSKIGG